MTRPDQTSTEEAVPLRWSLARGLWEGMDQAEAGVAEVAQVAGGQLALLDFSGADDLAAWLAEHAG